MIPFFVVDRPISLKIIGGVRVPTNKQVGLMAHAYTSENFRRAFREYSHPSTIKMCDSAIFDSHRDKTTYNELYKRYEEMGADYGVIIDVLRDRKATLSSAKKALELYKQRDYSFNLVGVAQGTTAKEYLDCYEELKQLGFTYIAVGGLLHKRERSARYMRVQNEGEMRDILLSISETFKPQWLFALGCLHPSRLDLFKKFNIWGDYKGWIFEYKKRDYTLKESIETLANNHMEHTTRNFRRSAIWAELKRLLVSRQRAVKRSIQTHEELLLTKRSLRDLIIEIEAVLRPTKPIAAKLVSQYRSRGLLKNGERDQILNCLSELNLEGRYRRRLNDLMKTSREKKSIYLKAERAREGSNLKLSEALRQLKTAKSVDDMTIKLASRILTVLDTSEQIHRITQVRVNIEKNILDVV